MNVLIYGLGIHGGGLERARYFLSHGDKVRITDSRSKEELDSSVDYLESLGAQISVGQLKEEDFKWADIVIKAQSIKLDNEYLRYAQNVSNDFSCFFSSPLLKDIKLIIITGNGKTATASAICQALTSLGKSARRCGSMGTSPLTELMLLENGDKPEYIVVEMSVWQLRDTVYFMNGVIPECQLVSINSTTDDRGNLGVFFQNPQVKKIICTRALKQELKDSIPSLRSKDIYELENYTRKASEITETLHMAYASLKILGFSSSSVLQF